MRVRVCQIAEHWFRGSRRDLTARCVGVLAALSFVFVPAAAIAQQDIVLHSPDVTTIRGNWSRVSSSSAASSQRMTSSDQGWASTDTALASPGNYFEATFNAQASTPYRVWVRLRATGDSKWNDSIWVQFSDSVSPSGSALYRIGSSGGLLINLEPCNGCGVSGWGWGGGAWWLSQSGVVQFPSAGSKTVRIQTREDGVEVDQIVLSPLTYLHSAPGATSWDTTILPRSIGGSSGSAPQPVNDAKAIPGVIQAEDFDNGGNGAAYWDSTSGNTGGQYRATDVDVEGCSEGGYNVGWIASGEWLNYTVNVASAGTYTLEFRVAALGGGGSLRAEFNGQDKTGSVSVPATGGWQAWTTVQKTVTLSAGTQVMKLVFDNGSFNINYVRAVSGGSSSGSSSSSPTPFGGTARALPGTVQAADFDNGGSGVAYLDNSPGNAGGAYRSTDVDIASMSGGYTVGWVGAGEWLRYTVNVTASGEYALTARVAHPGTGGTFRVEFNGADRTGSIRVPNTGGWEAYQNVSVNVSLTAGVQAMRLVFESNGSTGAVGNFASITIGAVPAAPAPPPPSPSPAGGRVRVMTWNIHFGNGDTWGQCQEIANSGADVVLLQEAQTWDENMPRTYPDRLRQMTGQTWYSAWGASSPGGGGSQGTLILSRYPIVDSSAVSIHGAGTARALIDIGGVRINFFNVHLEYYNTGLRSTQLLDFMSWMRRFPGPRIAGGDFNSWWGEWWIHQMKTEYSDTWEDVKGTVEGGFTCCPGNVRFDYLFRSYDQNWRTRPTAIWVPWTGRSDHYPVIADYTVQ